jgi:hypothetical protein
MTATEASLQGAPGRDAGVGFDMSRGFALLLFSCYCFGWGRGESRLLGPCQTLTEEAMVVRRDV